MYRIIKHTSIVVILLGISLTAVGSITAAGPPDVVNTAQKIAHNTGGLGAILQDTALFGSATTAIGDLNGDGVPDLAVGAPGIGTDEAVYILFMKADGTVNSWQKLAHNTGGLGAIGSNFGYSVAGIGDLNGDGVPDLAVGAYNTGDSQKGEIYVLFMKTDGTVASWQKIAHNTGGLGPVLNGGDFFGNSVTAIGDLNGDNVSDLVVGAYGDDTGANIGERGAVYILFMKTDGTVASWQKIAHNTGGLGAILIDFEWFGASVAKLGDLNGDNVPDLVVGSYGKILERKGAIYILF